MNLLKYLENKDNRLPLSPALVAIFLFGILFAALECRLSLIPNSYSLKNTELKAQSEKIECLVLGSSHTYFDIKPDKLSFKTFNLANTSQSLQQDLSLLKHFIDKLPNLKMVIIPISYFTLEYSNIDSPEDWRDCYTFHFLGASEAQCWQFLKPGYWSLLYLYGPSKIRQILKTNFQTNYAEDIDKSGWYFGDYGSGITELSAAERVRVTEQSMKSEYIQKNIRCLKEILDLGKAHNIKIVLLSTPVHTYYYQKLNKDRWSKAQKIVNELAKEYKTIYMDYSHDTRFSTDKFRDNDHLNPKGAALFSEILNKRICEI